MNSNEISKPNLIGFDSVKYYKDQKNAIIKRLQQFTGGKLYLEIGGKFLFDPHAARVLPGFDPSIKQKIFADLKDITEVLFCVDAKAIIGNRQLKNIEESYQDATQHMIEEIEQNIGIKPVIVLNRCEQDGNISVEAFVQKLRKKGYKVFKRFVIKDYPHNIKHILSDKGYGNDDYIKLDKSLILVTGAASNSGKLSTCLGQLY